MTFRRWKCAAALAALTWGGGTVQAATPLLEESFDSVASLAGAGWLLSNASTVPGSSWFQGNSGVFAAESGAADAYIAANFLAAGSGALSLWLITPTLDLSSAGTLSFYTRTDGSGFADSLQVLASSDASGSTASFTTLLYGVNTGEAVDGYPSDWTRISVSYGAIGGSARLAFVYSQSNVDNANYIGIDSVSVSAVPEPASVALLAAGLGLVALRRRVASN